MLKDLRKNLSEVLLKSFAFSVFLCGLTTVNYNLFLHGPLCILAVATVQGKRGHHLKCL
jgi:hypothetical protein